MREGDVQYSVERQSFDPDVFRQLLEVWSGYWRLPEGTPRLLTRFTEREGLSLSEDALQFYYLMALDAGLVVNYVSEDGRPTMGRPQRVTYRGQCFLEETREKPAWDKVRKAMSKYGTRVGIELAYRMAVKAAMDYSGIGSP